MEVSRDLFLVDLNIWASYTLAHGLVGECRALLLHLGEYLA